MNSGSLSVDGRLSRVPRSLRYVCLLYAFIAFAAAARGWPPRMNAAWVYDPQPQQTGGTLEAGHFVEALDNYNSTARRGHRIRELYVYAGDLEMLYCPDHDPSRCRARDMHVYYAGRGRGPNASVSAYAQALHSPPGSPPVMEVPVLDGTATASGTLPGFNRLKPSQARAFADKAARKVCADPNAAGVEFDLEPFDVSTHNGQYHFYMRIAKDFASSTFGCVDETHPRGRFFAIFTSARPLRPNTPSAHNVQAIMHKAHNGYLIDALYDLTSAAAGQRTPVERYARVVENEIHRMRVWARRAQVRYQFGLPAAASAHEYAGCRGERCRPGNNAQIRQLDYVRAAIKAIDRAGIRHDPLFAGVALWAWSPSIRVEGMQLTPAQPPRSVTQFLDGRL